MKFSLNATIAMFLLFTGFFFTSYTHASKEENKSIAQLILSTKASLNQTHNHEKEANVFQQKWKLFSKKNKLQKNKFIQDISLNIQPYHETHRVQFVKFPEPSILQELPKIVHLSPNSLLLATTNNILFLVVNQFLTIKDIFVLQKTCKAFQNLLQPNHENMVTFCNYGDAKKRAEIHIIWDDLKYFLHLSDYNLFDDMEIFNVKENLYAALSHTHDYRIIIWHNYLNPYPRFLFHKTQNEILGNKALPYESPKVYLKFEKRAWAKITKEGNVEIGGDKIDFENNVHLQLKKVKSIFSSARAFAVILENGSVVAWGNPRFGGEIPVDIQIQLKNVKMIFSNFKAFVALLDDHSVLAWGCDKFGGKIAESIQTQLHNIQIIVSTGGAFAALQIDGSVIAWGDPNLGGAIPLELQTRLLNNVKMIVSEDSAFAALLKDGSVVFWGSPDSIGEIPTDIQIKLSKNVKTIVSTKGAFCALFNDGSVIAVIDPDFGGEIPTDIQIKISKNVMMVLSTYSAFAALLNDGSVVAWGYPLFGGEIPVDIQIELSKNVKMIFSNEDSFVALLEDGSVFTWGNGGPIPVSLQQKLIKNIQIVFPQEIGFTAICKNGEVITWGENEDDKKDQE